MRPQSPSLLANVLSTSQRTFRHAIRLTIAVAVCVIGSSVSLLAQESPRPNIILLIADDLGYGEVGAQGFSDDIPTPHLDALAARGVRFTNGYVTSAYCSTSRAGLLTGRYQNRFGYDFNPVGADNEDPRVGLPTNELTIADALQRRGYATGLIGKWHLGGTAAFHPVRRGFDEFFGFMHEGHYFVPPPYEGVVTMLRRRALPDGRQGRWVSEDGTLVLGTHMRNHEPDYDANNPIVRVSQPVVEEEYLTDAFTRESIDFLRRNRERPFFLCVAYNAVHSPLQARQEDFDRFPEIKDVQRRIFAGMLANLDDNVGRLVEAVDELGLRENTIIVFLSDNGGPTRELTSSNGPLRDGKGSVYEGGLRVPFFISWPSKIRENAVVEEPVISLDLFPTFLSAAGEDWTDWKPNLDGVDLLPTLSEDQETALPSRSFSWKLGPQRAIRYGDWKLVRSSRGGGGQNWELYDLSEDIGESNNLIEQNPAAARELQNRFDSWQSEMKPAFWSRGG